MANKLIPFGAINIKPPFEDVLIRLGKLEHQVRVASYLLMGDGYDQRAQQLENEFFKLRQSLKDTIAVIEGDGA